MAPYAHHWIYWIHIYICLYISSSYVNLRLYTYTAKYIYIYPVHTFTEFIITNLFYVMFHIHCLYSPNSPLCAERVGHVRPGGLQARLDLWWRPSLPIHQSCVLVRGASRKYILMYTCMYTYFHLADQFWFLKESRLVRRRVSCTTESDRHNLVLTLTNTNTCTRTRPLTHMHILTGAYPLLVSFVSNSAMGHREEPVK